MEDKLQNVIVIKRDGKRVAFEGLKIAMAIKKGFDSIEGKYTDNDVNKVYNKVIDRIISSNRERIKIEEIQDIIEDELKINDYEDVYKSFASYREKRNQSREIFFEEKRKHKFLKALEKLGLSTKDEAENIVSDKNTLQAMIAYGQTVSQEFTTSYLMKKKFAEAHENGDIHINYIDYYPMGATESCQINLEKLFTDGFKAGNCSMREPQSISSYSILTTVAIASNQKDQSDEQSIPAFDFYMATGVLKTFKKEFRQTIYDILEYTDYDKFIAKNGIEREIDKLTTIDFDIRQFYKFTREAEELKRMFRIVYKKAMEKTNLQVYQSMEGLVHDVNSLCTNQITTLNIGTDTSAEGRMITKNLLRVISEGIGENQHPKSPKIVFKIKKGVNFLEKDPNYDLLKKACEIAMETDNISFSFLDTQYNSQYYKEGDFNTEVAYFSNGTRVIDNVIDNDKTFSTGRGVISSTVINLPRIALKHKNDMEGFFVELKSKTDLVKDQLLERLEIQSNKKAYNFPFLMKQDVWIDSEKIRDDDKVRRILKQGAMEIKFTGLNECVTALTGIVDFDSDNAKKLALKIVNTMKEKTEEYQKKYSFNFFLAGNENEEIDKEFLELDRVVFGKIKNVTDKKSYSPSFEILDNIDINKKIKLESEFHELTCGGHRFIIKKDSKMTTNDLLKLINQMYKEEIGFVKVI